MAPSASATTAGITVAYEPQQDGSLVVRATSANAPVAEASFAADRADEGKILYMEATELVATRAQAGEPAEQIRPILEKLFAVFRGEATFEAGTPAPRPASGDFVPNPGKTIETVVDGVTWLRLPVRTRLITLADTDLTPLLDEYVKPFLQPGDIIFISEKVLTITQGRVVDFSEIYPSALARVLARRVGNNYGTADFKGVGHGTALAMQLLIEEAGTLRVLFAAAVAALTRPLGIKGAFYFLCGKSAKSVDCPMSFLILEYAHAAKLAPKRCNAVSKEIKKRFGHETVIVDANYRGAFSLGKSSRNITEKFIGQVLKDNPAGQSAEMTPFFIIRKKI
jgi:hypothetical protein